MVRVLIIQLYFILSFTVTKIKLVHKLPQINLVINDSLSDVDICNSTADKNKQPPKKIIFTFKIWDEILESIGFGYYLAFDFIFLYRSNQSKIRLNEDCTQTWTTTVNQWQDNFFSLRKTFPRPLLIEERCTYC